MARINAAVLLLILLPYITEAKHFRYGTVRWTPTTRTIEGAGSLYEAEFQLQLAFARSYDWGAYFKEQWRDRETSDEWNMELGVAVNKCMENDGDGNDAYPNLQCFSRQDEPGDEYITYYDIKFPVGMGVSGYDLVPNVDGLDTYIFHNSTVGKQPNPLADAENFGGTVCKCRFHKGVEANRNNGCASSFTNRGGGLQTLNTGQPLVNNPYLPATSLGAIETNDDASRIKDCSPWSEVFGFFYGDGSQNDDGVVVSVTHIDFEDTLSGNFFRGTSEFFRKTYPTASDNGLPFVAFFTGGNRITTLNNNKQGRYRLETGVLFRDSDLSNRSPVGSQIPLLPVPYTASGARFQVPAYDPDADGVQFFLGSQEEQGGLLANAVDGTYTYHRDVYRYTICNSDYGPYALCSVTANSGLTAAQAAAYPLDADNPNTPLYPDWVDDDNLPHAPQGLTIDHLTGIVNWTTGVDMAAMPPGFYNLVVMVEERKPDDNTVAETRNAASVKIPIDFLIFLYPPMHFCNMDCLNDETSDAPRLATFESRTGFYGHEETETGTWPDAGTGKCKICGGGGYYNNIVNQENGEDETVVYDTNSLNNGTVYCSVRPTPTGKPVESCCSGSVPDTFVEYGRESEVVDRSLDVLDDYQGCLGAGPDDLTAGSIVPYSGKFDVCNQNTAPFFLTRTTTRDGIGETPELDRDNSVAPFSLEPPARATLTSELGKTVSFVLQAFDDDDCVEISISDAGMQPNMKLGEPHRIPGLGDDNRPKSVQRNFTWGAYKVVGSGSDITLEATTSESEDMRDQYSVTCFYATDQYLLTSHPYHCVAISLVASTNVDWCPTPVYGSSPEFLPENPYLGKEVCIGMCVQKSASPTGAYNVDIRKVYEDDNNLTINFPKSADWNPAMLQNEISYKDPLNKEFCFTPQEGEECMYTVCFQGIDADTSQTTDTRCYHILVHNGVLSFDTSDDAAEVHAVSSMVHDVGGYSMSAWVLPRRINDGTSRNNTILMFTSTRDIPMPYATMVDKGVPVRSSIFWLQGPDAVGTFGYYDDRAGGVMTKRIFRENYWHYVAVTIGDDGQGALYVDGSLPQYDLPSSIDAKLYDVQHFSTTSRPDTGTYFHADDSTLSTRLYYGNFRIGGDGFHGVIDEVRVWDRQLSPSDVDADMFTRVAVMGEQGVVLALSMTPEVVPTKMPDVYGTLDTEPYPGVTPCSILLSHNIGPTAGGCLVSVEASGVAPSSQLMCAFGDYRVKVEPFQGNIGQYITCKAPAVDTPQNVAVTLSNDGRKFTDPEKVGRLLQYLYVESVLYMDGVDTQGANMDGVCEDLREGEEQDDQSVTFGGWFCPNCAPPQEM